jgi:glycerophosphoryl diester phosphodiesterase
VAGALRNHLLVYPARLKVRGAILNRIDLKASLFSPVFISFFLFGATLLLSPASPANETPAASAPIVIAHRGASGQRPEHTLAAYELALAEGADFIELDLVATRDGGLIARHENALAMVEVDAQGNVLKDADGRPLIREATTDVAERSEFADRLTVKSIDGRTIGGWFSEDFTRAEITSLKARERMPELRPQNLLYDDRYGVPALSEVLAFMAAYQRSSGKRPGLYVELKHPTYFLHEGRQLDGSKINQDLGELLLLALQGSEFLNAERLFIQAFEVAPLIVLKDRLDELGVSVPLIQLYGDISNLRYRAAPRDMVYYAEQQDLSIYGELDQIVEGGIRTSISFAELATPLVLAYMARRYAAGIGPPRQNVMLTKVAADSRHRIFTGESGPLLTAALAAGLLVHPYTLRAEPPFLLRTADGLMPVAVEAQHLLEAGVQGFFIDQPAEGRLAVDRFKAASQPEKKTSKHP